MNSEFDYKALGKRIRTCRKRKNITQEKLAELCNLSTAHIGHIERGTRSLLIESLVSLSKVLNVSTDYLLLDISNEYNSSLNDIFNAISLAEPVKYERFYSIVKIMAEKIDEL